MLVLSVFYVLHGPVVSSLTSVCVIMSVFFHLFHESLQRRLQRAVKGCLHPRRTGSLLYEESRSESQTWLSGPRTLVLCKRESGALLRFTEH